MITTKAELDKAHNAVAVAERQSGPSHPDVAITVRELAYALKRADYDGHTAAAEDAFRRALKINEAAFGADDPRVANDLTHLGLHLHDVFRFTEAEKCLRRALAIDEKAFGPDALEVSQKLSGLADLLSFQARWAEAEPVCRRSLLILFRTSRNGNVDHDRLENVMNTYQRCLSAMGRNGGQIRLILDRLANEP